MIWFAGLLLAQTAVAVPEPLRVQPAADRVPAQTTSLVPVQLGVRMSADTVTVGEMFVVVIRVRVPAGATVRFPFEADSAPEAGSAPLATRVVGRPAVAVATDASGVTRSAAYRLAAWDTGIQSLSLPDIVVLSGADSAFVSLSDRRVFVRSVLPADTLLHVPKPPRAQFVLTPFNWLPWVALAAALVLAGLIWRMWIWYRRRVPAKESPFVCAQRDFARIESLHLSEHGEAEKHVTLMTDVMRRYLAARVPGIESSHTSSEIMARAGDLHRAAPSLGELLWQTDLIKFARRGAMPNDAQNLGQSARAVVASVEDQLSTLETKQEPMRRAA